MFYVVVGLILVALIFDYINGFHDAANSIATVVSTRVLSPGKAVIWAAFFNFVAAFTFGTAVAKTVGSGMIDIKVVTFAVIFGGLVGAIVWDLITWYFGLPTSSSHALIGGYAGAAVAKAGFAAIIPGGWTKTLIFIVSVAADRLRGGSALMTAIFWLFRWTPPSRVDRWFRRLQLVSAAFFSLNHGANDAQKTMGIIAGVLFAAGYIQTFYIPFWVVLAGAHGDRSRHAGRRLAHHPHDGIEDHQAAAGRRLRRGNRRGDRAAHRRRIIGVPVSTTHAITGAIVGVGATRRLSAVRWGVAGPDRLGVGADDSRRLRDRRRRLHAAAASPARGSATRSTTRNAGIHEDASRYDVTARISVSVM